MKRVIAFSAIIIISLSLAGCTTPSITKTSEEASPSTWKTYTSNEHNFSIQYPASLSPINNQHYGELIRFSNLDPTLCNDQEITDPTKGDAAIFVREAEANQTIKESIIAEDKRCKAYVKAGKLPCVPGSSQFLEEMSTNDRLWVKSIPGGPMPCIFGDTISYSTVIGNEWLTITFSAVPGKESAALRQEFVDMIYSFKSNER